MKIEWSGDAGRRSRFGVDVYDTGIENGSRPVGAPPFPAFLVSGIRYECIGDRIFLR